MKHFSDEQKECIRIILSKSGTPYKEAILEHRIFGNGAEKTKSLQEIGDEFGVTPNAVMDQERVIRLRIRGIVHREWSDPFLERVCTEARKDENFWRALTQKDKLPLKKDRSRTI
jgi:hypothetical protein